ncbi:TetR/AcrR family transcriptional regulator [Isoptericola variabilis]|uniref:Regulatory protein TetR n=1 Tax=Isoptericola variabilis (strain 225) TaxID=743718 RepID=F6FTV7_ISOV2|nr:TetR/AcrR family transcriptional regulator [Isoptericola variabilis]AEG45328.1 regulatory protein TetR [Isoptericola variabilis 225]TWH34831.1 TetR family transcriptional regulator [Isoptericola variabilis J7]
MKRLPLAQRRAHLADVALRIAARSGIESVTIRAVAREAGVSLGTVHYCFDDKDELLREMGRALVGVAVDPVRGASPSSGDFRDVLHAAVDGLMEGLRSMEDRRLLSFELATAGARSSAMTDVAQAHIDQVSDMAVGVLTELADRADVRYRIDVALLARLVVAFIDGLELRWLVERDDDATLEAFHELADVIASYASPGVEEVPVDATDVATTVVPDTVIVATVTPDDTAPPEPPAEAVGTVTPTVPDTPAEPDAAPQELAVGSPGAADVVPE